MLPDYFVPEEGSSPVWRGPGRVPVFTAPSLRWGMGGAPPRLFRGAAFGFLYGP
jgi:hypothetical protein